MRLWNDFFGTGSLASGRITRKREVGRERGPPLNFPFADDPLGMDRYILACGLHGGHQVGRARRGFMVGSSGIVAFAMKEEECQQHPSPQQHFRAA